VNANDYELIQKYRTALEQIANFNHLEDCQFKFVPIGECTCTWGGHNQWEIAKKALEE